jgi:hypothetical protein
MACDMDDTNDLPPDSKLTRSKQRWAQEGKFLTGKIARPEEQRLPPGQHLTRDWPVLDLGLMPEISHQRWRLDVYGAVENPVFWNFAEFTAQPQTQFVSDIHCVTTWSRYDNQWEGLAARDLLMACQPKDDARFVVLHSMTATPPTSRWKILPLKTPCSPIAGRESRSMSSMADRCVLWCHTSISGRVQSGCRRSSFLTRTSPAIGKSAAITIEATPGRKSGIRGIDVNAVMPGHDEATNKETIRAD